MAPTDRWCSDALSDSAAALINPHRSAPPVSYPVGRSFVCRRLLLGATALAVLMQVALLFSWGLPVGLTPVAWWASSALWVLTLGWAWRSWLGTTPGWLSWAPDATTVRSGSPAPMSPQANTGWWWSDGEGVVGEPVRWVQPTMVFDQWMLLRVTLAEGTGATVWMWLEARALPARWRAWRRAVMAHGH